MFAKTSSIIIYNGIRSDLLFLMTGKNIAAADCYKTFTIMR